LQYSRLLSNTHSPSATPSDGISRVQKTERASTTPPISIPMRPRRRGNSSIAPEPNLEPAWRPDSARRQDRGLELPRQSIAREIASRRRPEPASPSGPILRPKASNFDAGGGSQATHSNGQTGSTDTTRPILPAEPSLPLTSLRAKFMKRSSQTDSSSATWRGHKKVVGGGSRVRNRQPCPISDGVPAPLPCRAKFP